jgi:hypothetical protein
VSLSAGTVTLTATADSALSVAFTSHTKPVCTVHGHTVTLIADGTCRITASQHGDDTYAPADPVTQEFTVHAGPSVPPHPTP